MQVSMRGRVGAGHGGEGGVLAGAQPGPTPPPTDMIIPVTTLDAGSAHLEP